MTRTLTRMAPEAVKTIYESWLFEVNRGGVVVC
jgi:hypothetical protein